MRATRILVTLIAFAVAGCGTSDNAQIDMPTPELAVTQLGGVGIVASQETGGTPVNLKIRIFNSSKDPITLKRLDFKTVAYGAYTVVATSRPFNESIAAGQGAELKTWVPAEANDTIVGANGPVTMQVVAYFDSAQGQFRKVYTEQVNTDLSPMPKPTK